jgi:hypothetical protein
MKMGLKWCLSHLRMCYSQTYSNSQHKSNVERTETEYALARSVGDSYRLSCAKQRDQSAPPPHLHPHPPTHTHK